jgi:hypothetical protein
MYYIDTKQGARQEYTVDLINLYQVTYITLLTRKGKKSPNRPQHVSRRFYRPLLRF